MQWPGFMFEFGLSMFCMIERYSLVWYLFQNFVGILVLSRWFFAVEGGLKDGFGIVLLKL